MFVCVFFYRWRIIEPYTVQKLRLNMYAGSFNPHIHTQTLSNSMNISGFFNFSALLNVYNNCDNPQLLHWWYSAICILFFLYYYCKKEIIVTIEEIWKCLTLTRASTEFIGQELQIVITNDTLMMSDNNIFMITSSYCCVFVMHEDVILCIYLTKYLQQCWINHCLQRRENPLSKHCFTFFCEVKLYEI